MKKNFIRGLLTVSLLGAVATNAQTNETATSQVIPLKYGTVDLNANDRAAPRVSDTEDWRLLLVRDNTTAADLQDYGITSLNYLLENTILAHIPAQVDLEAVPVMVSTTRLKASDKINPDFQDEILAGPESDEVQALVRVFSNVSDERFSDILQSISATDEPNSGLPNYVKVVTFTASKLSQLLGNPEILTLERVPKIIERGDPFYFCPGAMTEFGPKAPIAAKWEIINQGWDGNGQGSARVRYHFENGTPDIGGSTEHTIVRRALDLWSYYVDIDFNEVNRAGRRRSLDISWGADNHGDNAPFDGPGGVLAHAFAPGNNDINGDIHFDEDELWSTCTDFHLYSVAVHEIGHAIGLDHSDVDGAVMEAIYDGVIDNLSQDDVDGARSIYSSTGNSIPRTNDRTLFGDVNNNGENELVIINTSYIGRAIRVVDVSSGSTIRIYNHGECTNTWNGWMDNTDKAFLADADGNGTKDLVLVNTSYTGGAIRAFDLMTGNDISWTNHGTFGSWMDASDRMFIANYDNDPEEELILVNTAYSGGAIRAVNLQTGATESWLNHGPYSGWMDGDDRMFVGDVNGDTRDELILTNSAYAGGAIYAVNIANGNTVAWINHGSFGGWMDILDRMAVGDVNGDSHDDIVFLNTGYTGGAVRALDVMTGNNIIWLNHGSLFNGWMDNCDRSFLANVDGTAGDDLVLVNTSYSGGAMLSINLQSGAQVGWVNHGPYGNWMDGNDRMFAGNVNTSGPEEIVMVNTGMAGGAIGAVDVLNGNWEHWTNHNGQFINMLDRFDENSNCVLHRQFKNEATNTITKADDNTRLDFMLAPNPNDGIFQLSLQGNIGASLVEVYNLQGKRVKQFTLNENERQTMDLQDQPVGLYILKVTNGVQVATRRVIIQR